MTLPDETDLKAHAENIFSRISQGKIEEAKQALDFLLGNLNHINDASVLSDLAELCIYFSDYPTALQCLDKSLEKQPVNAIFLGLKGRCLVMAQRYQEAVVPLQKALQINPLLQKAAIDLATAWLELKQSKEALNLLTAELSRSPEHPALHRLLAMAYSNRGDNDKAIQYASTALLSTSNESFQHLLHYIIGRNQSELGQTDDAVAAFQQSIATDPHYGIAYHGLAQTHKFSESDLPFVRAAENALVEMTSSDDRSMAHFALGKIYDDLGDFDAAFDHYQRGNTLRKPARQPRPNHVLFWEIKHTFSAESLASANTAANLSNMPIFIVGMPRSGSTLIEQILSSHPDVAAGGELAGINRISDTLQFHNTASDYKSAVICASNDGSLSRLADEYLGFLRNKAHGTKRVTDKEPSNYLHLGLIHMLFPNSTIIHAVRNPLDTSLSCYFQPFENIHWSTDLQWIADEFVFYREVMDYWKTNLPSGRFIDICYETLISNPESTIRNLLQQCGLPWDERCLDFHQSNNRVRTASLYQVRQPLYQSSRARWMHYHQSLKPLAESLAPFLDAEERQALRVGV